MSEAKWNGWMQQLQAIAQNGLTFATDSFDVDRYTKLRKITSEMVGAIGGLDPEMVLGQYSKEIGYATPKVDVRGAVIKGNKILLVREIEDGGWTLPGGWADVGDSPSEAVLREIWEESGYEAKVLKLVAVQDRNRHPHPEHPQHIYKLFFLCEITGGEAKHSNETDGVGFFAEDALPPLSLGRTLPEQIALLFEHSRNPELATVFD